VQTTCRYCCFYIHMAQLLLVMRLLLLVLQLQGKDALQEAATLALPLSTRGGVAPPLPPPPVTKAVIGRRPLPHELLATG
jgi:hypothetical protein